MSADAAMLDTLGYKYDGGGNSRFGMFAARMLELNDPKESRNNVSSTTSNP
jgi:hypothetical protein